MFGHASWMQRMTKGCYIDTGDLTNGVGGDPADTKDADDDSLDTDTEDEEGEKDKGPEAKPDADKGDPDVDAAQDNKKPDKPKQSPEFDAVAARLRKTEEKAAQLEAALQAGRAKEEAEKAQRSQQDKQAKVDQEWNGVLQQAEKMKTDGYDNLIVNEYVERQRDRILNRLKIEELEQKLTQSQQQIEQRSRQQQDAQAVKSFFEEIGELRKEYGDLVPDTSGVKANLEGFFAYTKKLPPEMMDRIARGYSPTDAFIAANHKKLNSREKSLVQKRTVANISDRINRGITSDSEGAASYADVPVNNEMAAAFGNDPKEIAKYVKQQIKRR
jgi:hypothetical protein